MANRYLLVVFQGSPYHMYLVNWSIKNTGQQDRSMSASDVFHPCDMQLSETHIDESCDGYADGSIDLTVSGNKYPVSYFWSNGASTEDISNLTAGTYKVVVKENCPCLSCATRCQDDEEHEHFVPCCSDSLTVVISTYDSEAPTASNPKDIIVQCKSDVPAPDPAVVTDEKDNVTINPVVTFDDQKSNGNTCPEIIKRRYKVTDDCGLFIYVFQNIIIDDTIDPTFNGPLPADATVECDAIPAVVKLSASDNCDKEVSILFDEVIEEGLCINKYDIIRTWTASDACGNSVTHAQVIKVQDTTAPKIACPPDIMVQCNSDIPKPDTSLVIAEDNCGKVTVVHTGDVSNGQTCPETISRTYQATDQCGNTAECTQLITINDTIPPAIICPPDATIECNESSSPDALGEATATDNCDDLLDINYSDVSTPGSCPQALVITRTWTAKDDCGNLAECVQTINVVDTTPPSVLPLPAINVECIENVPAPAPRSVLAKDNCSRDLRVIHKGDVSNGQLCPEVITRTYIVSDPCGNATEVDQIITVHDVTPPVVAPLDPINIQCLGDVPKPDITTIRARDNCDAPLTVKYEGDAAVGACPTIITRTYSVTDACDNTTTIRQRIVVDDITPPTLYGSTS